MSNTERAGRIKALSKIALGILRRNGDSGNIDSPSGRRTRISEFRYDEFRFSTSRGDDGTATVTVWFVGSKVLAVEWTAEQILRTSYKPGEWEEMLRHYGQIPALAGRGWSDGSATDDVHR